nr:hypothetical protein [Bacteroides intestinalis]
MRPVGGIRGGLSGILPEPYQRGGNPLFAPYHPQTGVPLTEDDTELVRFGYCPTPALALLGAQGKSHSFRIGKPTVDLHC